MILRLRRGTPDASVYALRARVEREGLRTYLSPDSSRPIIAIVDKASKALQAELSAQPEVEEVLHPSGEFLASLNGSHQLTEISTKAG